MAYTVNNGAVRGGISLLNCGVLFRIIVTGKALPTGKEALHVSD